MSIHEFLNRKVDRRRFVLFGGTAISSLLVDCNAPATPTTTPKPTESKPIEPPTKAPEPTPFQPRSTAAPVKIVTAEPVALKITRDITVAQDPNDRSKWRVDVCTNGITGITTQVLANKEDKVSGKEDWDKLKEFAGPCFTTNDRPELYPDRYTPGIHIIRVQVRQDNISSNWADPSVLTRETEITICREGNRNTIKSSC